MASDDESIHEGSQKNSHHHNHGHQHHKQGAQGGLTDDQARMAELGRQLFFDVSLSKNRTQSCASCHSPAKGFADPGTNALKGAVSLGDDGESFGDRNTPTITYAKHSPEFGQHKNGDYRGGQFHDGRASGLAEQAGGPPLNPIEMALSSKAEAVSRLQENPVYESGFKALFGDDIWQDENKAYDAMTQSLAAFQSLPENSPFDSKYDRFLRGEVKLTKQEALGRTLFFSQQFTNCNQCHQLRRSPRAKHETFTDYTFHNIGVPVNTEVRAKNGMQGHIDQGLFAHHQVIDPAELGKFKVPTLRNVAVTAPYMHNGVFKDLRTVVLFYDKYNSKKKSRQVNPETGQPWAEPEVLETISFVELEFGPALEDRRVDALVAFLNTLTDKRYEALLTPAP